MAGNRKLFKLVSFNGSQLAPLDVEAYENYWRLIGQVGRILEADRPYGIDKDRVLVNFEPSLDGMGLENHNETPNSLWIRLSDLEVVEPSRTGASASPRVR
jgi:hypothetical protein